MTKFYGTIDKTEKQADGTMIVSGFASSEATDSDGEIIKADAIAAAIPDYMKFANVREMHKSDKASGTVLEMVVQDDGRTFVKTHIVDAEACKKVEHKVYKGFSIGGKVTSRDDKDAKVIKGLTLSEISLVDRPANPEAIFTFAKVDDAAGDVDDKIVADMLGTLEKREFNTKERKAAAKSGAAMPDGSFPIENKKDLENAIHAIGRAKDPDKAKAHIKARAKALGAESMLPDDWKKADQGGDLKKGMYHVAGMAHMLQCIKNMQQECEAEKDREGDDSEVPEQLQQWLKDGIEIFKDMADEETTELHGDDEDEDEDDEDTKEMTSRATTLIKAAWTAGDVEKFEKFLAKKQTRPLAKAGKRNSAADQEKLDAIHKHASAIADHAEAMGADCGYVADNEKSAKSGDLKKVASALLEVGKIVDAKDNGDIVEKVTELKKDNEELVKMVELFSARVKEFEKLPMPPKGTLKVVAKTEDGLKPDNKVDDSTQKTTTKGKLDAGKEALLKVWEGGGKPA